MMIIHDSFYSFSLLRRVTERERESSETQARHILFVGTRKEECLTLLPIQCFDKSHSVSSMSKFNVRMPPFPTYTTHNLGKGYLFMLTNKEKITKGTPFKGTLYYTVIKLYSQVIKKG